MTTRVVAAAAPKPSRRRVLSARFPALASLGRDRVGMIGAAMATICVLAAVLAPLLARHDPETMNYTSLLSPPTGDFWLGTDGSGRDLLSRALYGARTSVSVGVVVVTLAALVGVPIGLLAGYYRGLVDGLSMRLVDVLFAFPTLLLALTVVATLGPEVRNLVLALTVIFMPSFARVTRGAALTVCAEPYVEAARSVGVPDRRIIARYVLPNVAAPIAVQFTISLAAAILTEAALSYLGLGVPPPTPSWGSMLNEGKAKIEQSAWPSVVPGACIMITVLGFNLLGDALRDALDPRLRGRA